ncbi:MAG: ferrous iron transport protein B [Anaerolineae bacterium]
MANPLTQTSCHATGPDISLPDRVEALEIALAGQPNVGKSTVFNMLTGLNQHVGNWPGKTIERKIGQVDTAEGPVRIVDLPGTYSLTANSPEERVARDYIIHERPDAIIAIVNAAALEHSLYLVAELLQLPVPLVIGLNMLDVSSQHGIEIEPHVLEAALGVPVIPLVATRNQGVKELLDAALHVARHPESFHPNRPSVRAPHDEIAQRIQVLIADFVPPPYPVDWVTIKLLEGDPEITELVKGVLPEDRWEAVHTLLGSHEDAFLDIVGGRYEWIERMTRAAYTRPVTGQITMTDRLDRLATHPWGGLALLSGILGLVFWLTYAIATPIQTWLDERVVQAAVAALSSAMSGLPWWLTGLVSEGIVAGVGTVLTFLPILLVFFAILGLLEDVGYLARAAYVMDRFMHLMGLHGKSFLPLFLGFGCNVPAVMGARIIEDRRTRLMTIVLTPLVPCTARLAVIVFLAPAFLGAYAALGTWLLATLNIVVLALLGIVIHQVTQRGAHTAFIMELPLYHVPNPRTIALFVWHNTQAFVRKAGTIILTFSVLIWALSVLPSGDVDSSILAWLGHALDPVARWIGWEDWRLTAALLSSFAAKENTIATLSILYASGGEGGLVKQVASVLTPAAGLAFLTVQMLFIPCAATTAVIRQETGSWKWSLASIGLLLVVSLLVGAAMFHVLSFLGFGG